jgi:hypothetical protein
MFSPLRQTIGAVSLKEVMVCRGQCGWNRIRLNKAQTMFSCVSPPTPVTALGPSLVAAGPPARHATYTRVVSTRYRLLCVMPNVRRITEL